MTMRLLIDGVIHDSKFVPIVIEFDEDERKTFNGIKHCISVPKITTEKEIERLLGILISCPHENITSWNHGYHNLCRDCGEIDV